MESPGGPRHAVNPASGDPSDTDPDAGVHPDRDTAFTDFVRSRQDQLRRTAYLLCHDWHRAEDLAQTAFVKLYGAWDRINDRAALDAYLRACLVRASIDESRRPWRRESAAETLPDSGGNSAAPLGFGAPSADTQDFAGAVADRSLVQGALARVPEGQRVILVLRFYEGLDVAQTAATLGCSEGNVKSQTARGLKALKEAIGPDGLAAFARHVQQGGESDE